VEFRTRRWQIVPVEFDASRVSDLFSLGSTLYQLLCGHLPFDGASEVEVMRPIVHEPHVDIASFLADIPPRVRGIVDRALEKQPEKRFQSGHEMADAIRQCAAQLD
jgi:eukaryotic-like serine/threonine-protein kinase